MYVRYFELLCRQITERGQVRFGLQPAGPTNRSFSHAAWEGWGAGNARSAARYAWLLTRPVADLSTGRGE
jgi:hypothetical protein